MEPDGGLPPHASRRYTRRLEGEPPLTQLEDISAGLKVRGIEAGADAEIVAVTWHGNTAMTVTYRTGTGVHERILYRRDEDTLEVVEEAARWTWDAPGEHFRLAAEARRIQLAHLFDPMVAVTSSLIEPLPHQIKAVYGEMLPRHPLRFLLADDPGAGKTIMAGLYIKELMLRGDVERCLVVAPGGLVTQWQDELHEKFGLRFEILTRDMMEATYSDDVFAERPLLIARLDQVARRDDLVQILAETDWDLTVVDEAHRMSAQYFGNELKETKRYKLGKVLSHVSRHFVLLTATPHSGKDENFQLFLALIDRDRFAGKYRPDTHQRPDVSDIMRRMIKERLLKFDGRPLFPERRSTSVRYSLSEPELRLYEAVSEYVREEMNRADRLRQRGEGRRGNTVGFALTVLQRRLASSPEAIYQSLRRRKERLQARIEETQRDGRLSVLGDDAETRLAEYLDLDDDGLDDLEDLEGGELEDLETQVVDQASASDTIAELEAEIEILDRLETMAASVRALGTDTKWQQLSGLLSSHAEMRDPAGNRRKLIVFTEHRDTLNYLVDRLRTFVGSRSAVVSIHGGTHRRNRREIQQGFMQDKDVLILVATDAAGEGINLQQAHLVINYDLPWNPNRIEQRFGRVHRIGQTEVCHMWNLIADQTREGQVYARLAEKIEEQRAALGGQVYDVLGEALSGAELRELMIDAVRYGDRPDIRARLEQVIDARIGEGVPELIHRSALSAEVMAAADVEEVRLRLEEAAAKRLQPHYIEAFFVKAIDRLGGSVKPAEPGRYEIKNVPAVMRRHRAHRSAIPVLDRYQRITFEKDRVAIDGAPLAELVAPGHRLLTSAIAVTLEQLGTSLTRGSILVDDRDEAPEPRVLVMLEHSIVNGRPDRHHPHTVVSRRFEFVEIARSGQAVPSSYAPYLDYRPAGSEDLRRLGDLLGEEWLRKDIEGVARDHAVAESVPRHLEEVTRDSNERVTKVSAAVRDRLTKEINLWDARANEIAERLRLRAAEAGEEVTPSSQHRMNIERARQRAEELAQRREERLAELELERNLRPLPPLVIGAAVVVPGWWFTPERAPTRHTKAVERRAVDAVLAAERGLGRSPEEMPFNNPGFDIRSRTPDGHWLFIEVKGRIKGADTVTVTRNEILHGLNQPERFVLALVEVDPDGGETVCYVRRPFTGEEDTYFDMTSVNYTWSLMWGRGEAPT